MTGTDAAGTIAVRPLRVYVPATVAQLRAAIATGELRPVAGTVFAVTTALRAEYPRDDDEELEYLAARDAALASLRLIAGQDPPGPALRVVAAADVETVTERPELDRAAATAESIAWRRVAAVYVDDARDEPLVRAAAAAVVAADLGDDDAQFTVGAAEDVELGWYTPREIRFLVEDLTGS